MESQREFRDIVERLFPDREFFVRYKQKFQEVFSNNIGRDEPKLLSAQGMNTLIDKLYLLMFSFNRNPLREIGELSYQLASYDIDLRTALSKTLLEMLKDYTDHVINTHASHKSVKVFLSLIELYMSEVEGAYTKYANELGKITERREKPKVEGERGLIIEFFENQFNRKNRSIELITFYKEVPVVCRSRILDMEEGLLTVKLCDLKVFNIDEEVYIKHPNLPKTVAAVIRDIDNRNEVMEVELIGFVDLPQERRGYVRVTPREPMKVRLRKGSWETLGIVGDISVGGVGVYLKDKGELVSGDTIDLYLKLPKGDIETRATVRHIEEREGVFRVGISYELDLKKEDIISDYIMERQFEILKELKGS
ncbi:PilZ domain-containing protein [Hydrogenivirga caldilitoris]|uniref:PilZ domain-containing protein n=1 Tax=Hydrogenivirga caldilitoris TaxID=246264 RepID=A0A497XPN7_9AQUI|nr:PilZ domain-containing protein [Hydrogenivirga caldilitoris]RLJ70079.1 PilZ domain-containing protein [Hydrogenivirga caldilitoris]